MKIKASILFAALVITVCAKAQTVINSKGTYTAIDSSKWTLSANDIFNKNSGNVGIGKNNPGSKLDVLGAFRLSGSTSGFVGFTVPAAAGSTTYTLPNADGLSGRSLITNGSGVLSWGIPTTTVSNTSAANNLSTTVNGVTGTNVSIINSNATSLATTNLTTTVNGVASTALDLTPAITATAWRRTGNAATTPGTDFIGTTDNQAFVIKTNNAEVMRILTSGNVGIGTTTPGADLDVKSTFRISGATSGFVGLSVPAAAGGTTYTLPAADGTSGQQLSTNGAGVLSWANQTGTTTVSNTSATNNLSTTVNGVTGTNVSIINSNATSLATTNLTTTVNGVASTALDLTPAITATAWRLTGNAGTVPTTNFIGTTDNIAFVLRTNNTERMRILANGNIGIGTNTPGSALDVEGGLRLSGTTSGFVGFTVPAAAGGTTYTLPTADGTSGQQLSTNGAGVLSWANQTGTTTVSNTSATNNLSTTVNGITGTNVSIINSNALGSVVNTLTSTVNGVASTGVPIINTNATSLAGTNLTTTVNGIAATALDLSPAMSAANWRRTGNAGTVAGTDFIGTTDNIAFVLKTNNVEAMRILTSGNVGIGTTTPGADLDVKSTFRISGATSGFVGLTVPAAAGGTTYTLPAADGTSGQQLSTNGAGVLSWANQTGTTTVSNTSATNNLSTTVNGVTGTNVSIINSNATSLATTNLTTTINGVASTALDLTPAVTATAWRRTGNAGTVAGTDFIGTTDNIAFVLKTNNVEAMRILTSGNVGIGTTTPGADLDVKSTFRISGATSGFVGLSVPAAAGSTTYTLPAADGTSGQQLSTNGAGVLSWANQTGTTTVSNTSATNNLSTTVNGVTGTNVSIINSNALASATNTLTSTVNGVASTGVNIINTNATSLATTNLTTTINGVASTALDLTPAVTATAWRRTGNAGTVAGTDFIGTTDNIAFVLKTNNVEAMRILTSGNVGIGTTTPGADLDVKSTFRISGATSGFVGLSVPAAAGGTTYTLPAADGTSGQQLSTNGAGVLSWANQTGTTTVSNTSATNNLSTTVNGVTGTNVSIINSNALGSATNTLTSTVNGVASTGVNIINTNATSLATTNLTTTVNGVASTALDLTPAITATAWKLTGNTGTTAGTNFIGTTDAKDFVTKTNNTEVMRITSAGDIGIGTTTPSFGFHISDPATTNVTAAGILAPGLAAGNSIVVKVGVAAATGNAGDLRFFYNGNNNAQSSFGLGFHGVGTPNVTMLNSGLTGIGTASPGSTLDVKGTLRLSGATSGFVGFAPAAAAGGTTYTLPTADGTSGQQLTTNGAGVLSWSNQTATTTVSNTSAANNLSTTVNGITGTNVSIINTNALSSATNTLTSTVNGVASTGVNIINTNATSLATANLTTTVNGVASTALDLTPAVTATAWRRTGNAGTVAGTDFIGTTDAIGFVVKTNNAEAMRILSGGNVGVGTNAPTQKLQVTGVGGQPSGMSVATTTAIFRVHAGSNNSLDMGLFANSPFGAYLESQNLTASNTLPLVLNPSGGPVGIGVNNPNSSLQVNGSMSASITAVSANITLDGTHNYIVLSVANTFTVTLPAASSCTGRIYHIKRPGATGTKTISSYLNVSGTATTTLAANTSIEIISDGTNWQEF